MNGIEGAGGPDILSRPLVEAAQSTRGTRERSPESETRDKPGMDGALALSRRYLSESLQGAGFWDIHAGSIARMEVILQRAASEEPEIELDPLMASEIAMHMGAELAGDVNQVLRILAQVCPEQVAMLLR